jgi:hypothetical protein
MNHNPNFICDLGEGLVLRRSTVEDAGALAQFNATIHGDDELDAIRVAVWTKDLLRGNHPTFGEGDYTLVEDTRSGKIVSSMNLISQTWSYEDIPFKVGRPELVGTDPDYRNRGLVRAQFEVIHDWSRERGELVQGITGIPYYYRLFGYEMTMNLGGARIGFEPHLPRLETDQSEPYRMRPVLESDLPFLAQLYEHGCQRSLVSCVRNAETWHYEVFGKSAENVNRCEFRVIENAAGEQVGYLAHPCLNWFEGAVLTLSEYEILPGASWMDISPSVVRYLWETGTRYAEGTHKQVSGFGLGLQVQHPAYEALHDRLPRERKPYAWYLRVPDLPAFLRHIRPVLEQRLASSVCAGYSGTLEISFYRSGVRLVFQEGKLVEVTDWKPAPPKVSGQAAFPGLTFLHLVFGYRSIEEIEHLFVDCWTQDDAPRTLIHALFPKKPSHVRVLS